MTTVPEQTCTTTRVPIRPSERRTGPRRRRVAIVAITTSLAAVAALASTDVHAFPVGRDVSECVNDPTGWTSDVCIVNSGQTGVGHIVFDRAARRRLANSTPAYLDEPLAVAVLENTSWPAPGHGAKDLVVVRADGLWQVPNDSPVANQLHIQNVARAVDPPEEVQNAGLRTPASDLLSSGSAIPSGARVEIFAAELDGDTEEEMIGSHKRLVGPEGHFANGREGQSAATKEQHGDERGCAMKAE